MTSKDNNNSEEADRLSSLPDPILIDILSKIPLDTAIGTTLLSRRWQHLWTQITTLNVNIDFISTHSSKFWNGLNEILPQMMIHTCTINIIWPSSVPLSSTSPYFPQISHRSNIKELKVLSKGYAHRWLRSLPSINCLFLISSLVNLELTGVFHFHWSFREKCENEINLPNLKVLKICILHHQWPLLGKLIKSCPSLDDFSLDVDYTKRGSLFGSINLSSLNLKRLQVILSQNVYANIEIDAPKLEYLNVNSRHGSTFYFMNKSNPIMLTQVDISDANAFHATMFDNIYQVFRNVRFLLLDRYEEFKELLVFLELCPVLEVLTLNLMTSSFAESKIEFPPNSTPKACMLTHLKRVEMNMPLRILLEKEDELINVVKYLLSNACVLECLIVMVTGSGGSGSEFTEDEQRCESRLCEKLFQCRRKSSVCQVEYFCFGRTRKTSDNGIGRDLITEASSI
ncbi:FBD-associated F-box protein At4g13985-like [Beta vulgaris subsp. vulgaris]|uniref:FBD-associated F-box protein At4g13985-like n=1 Tax=Beta vulgaris subsp. vulgaris TaxID=3555 RepID=UPI0020366D81|nr:FBD-associated F-box protein At4g13985-like [Beta vulgaris subsp. vulgaris]